VEQNLQNTIALLARTPAALDALLRDLPEAWTLRNEGEGTWSAFDIVGHLNHGERTDWMPRARMILELARRGRLHPSIVGDRSAKVRANRWDNCWMNLRACARRGWLNCAR